jgi:hypothetical protein
MSHFFTVRDHDRDALDAGLLDEDETETRADDEAADEPLLTPSSDHSDFMGRECGALGPSGLLLVD